MRLTSEASSWAGHQKLGNLVVLYDDNHISIEGDTDVAFSEDVLARYAACDLVVAPSRYESFGLTALEAMIFAKPCIASDVGGLPEVVADRETGLLVPPDDPEALAAALLRLINDEALRRVMGAAGRRRYEARFTAEKMAQAACAWFSSVVAAGRSIAAE